MPKSRSLPILAGVAALGALAVGSPAAHAAQIFVQQVGTAPAGGNAIGGEGNLITNTNQFVVGVAGNNTLQDPLLVIVGSFNGGTPSITFSGCLVGGCSLATVGTYGLNAQQITNFTSGDAYGALGLSETSTGAASETFANWSMVDQLNGFGTPNSFSLTAFAVPVSLTGPNQSTTIDEHGAAPGSFIIAYSCDFGAPAGAACSGGNVGSTPLTNAGVVVPAPPIGHGLPVLLAVSGILLGAKFWGRSKKRPLGTVIPHAS